ncbi:MAG: hypothetical protein J7M01_02750 [Candidatus Marinimicrobia bacterium]|nr:hypothetical protein [Candidatus Neomarinimicrobiota bacterium]
MKIIFVRNRWVKNEKDVSIEEFEVSPENFGLEMVGHEIEETEYNIETDTLKVHISCHED